MAKKLKKCPMCKSKTAPGKFQASDSDYKAVCCSIHRGGCGCSSGYKKTQREATAWWNTRGKR